MKRSKLNEITYRLQGKPFLMLVETSANSVPEAIDEYDPNMFICFNRLNHSYEVHSLANKGDTHTMSIPWETLDQRVIELVWRKDQKKHSLKSIIADMERHNREIDERRDRNRKNEIYSIASETRTVFKRYAEEYL
jgi:hypothetical protein